MNRSFLLSWEFVLLKLLLFAVVSVALDKPVGAIAGRIALEQEGFGLYSYNARESKVYVIAQGPRGDESVERGVFVQPDGSFRIDQLPVGEYSLLAHATGYATDYQSSIFVEESKITKIPNCIALSIQMPSVNIASNSRVFTTKEAPHFWLNTSGATNATVKLYRKDFRPFLDKTNNTKLKLEIGSDLSIFTPDKKSTMPFANEHAFLTLTRKLEPDQQNWAHAQFKLSQLPAGDYFIVAEVSNVERDSDWNITWFSVTDLGLIVKDAPDQILARAIDLNTLQPRSRVNIQFFDRINGTLTSVGATASGTDGLAVFKRKKSSQSQPSYDLIAYATAGKDKAYGGLSFYQGDSERYKTYFYTERPVYRLGQVVYYKGITRLLKANGFHTPTAGLPVSVLIEDPDNQKMWAGTLKTSPHGTFHGLFQIPDDAKTGAYQVTIKYPDNSTSYERFEVQQYRKPEYQVEVVPLTPQVVAGSPIKARIKATYFFGAPVTNARIRYSVYASPDWENRNRLQPRPAYYSYFDDWEDDESNDYYYSGYSGDFITEGYAQTDATGEAVIQFNSKKNKQITAGPDISQLVDKRYKIEAEVTDLSRMSVISSSTCQVVAGDFALFVEPNQYVCRTGEPLSVNVAAVDYNGQSVPKQEVMITLTRWVWDRTNYKYKGQETAGQITVITDQAGKAKATFTVKSALPTDTYYITAEASDKEEHLIRDESSIWIASTNYPYTLSDTQAEQEPLTFRLDKRVYQPGETARVLITAPIGKMAADALVSVEGTTIHDLKVVSMRTAAQLVEIPLKREYAPNVYVTVTFVGKNRQFYSQSKIVKISPEEHFLKLALATNKTKYKPGDSVTYTITATYPNGEPAANTSVSLGVVDESIYSIRPETAENIQKYFYSRRPNWVVTACSFPEQYSGGPNKIEPKLRKDFRDTAAWLPELLTNERGIAKATITLPDNLTTWRATARAIDCNTNVGSCINKIISTQDLILRLALPRFYCEGDEGVVAAVVHNFTDKTQSIQLTMLKSDQLQIKVPLTQSLSIAPDKAMRFDWPVKILSSGNATITVKAIGQTTGDAIERTVPICPLGLKTFSASNGLLTDDTATVNLPVGLSADASPSTANYELRLAASTLGPVLGNFNTLIDYPYGCTEQTLSRLIPSVVAIRLSKALKLPLTTQDQEKFQKVYKEAMKKLQDFQHADGGWGWWENDNSNAYLTAHVLEGMFLLKQVGLSTNKEVISKGSKWLATSCTNLLGQLNDPHLNTQLNQLTDSRIDLAKMLYTRCLWGNKIEPTAKSFLLRNVNKMSPEALSYLVLACTHSNDKQTAKQFYGRLIDLANNQDHYTNWDHTKELINKLRSTSESYDYTYRFTGVETSALALRAVLTMEPSNLKLIETIKNWLVLQRDKNGWGNTKTTAQVFMALIEEELLSGQKHTTDFTATADLLAKDTSGVEITNLAFNKSNLYDPEKVVPVPVAALPHQLLIKKNGQGRLYYNGLLTFFRHLSPGDEVAEKSLPQGLHLKREFFRLIPEQPNDQGQVKFKAEPIAEHTVKVGETVLMKIAVDAPIALPYLILEAALPSGAEVVSEDPRLSSVDNTENKSIFIGDWGPWWWTHQDILDDRIVFFVSHLPAGKSEFHTMVRLEMPGTFQLNPLNLEGMYTKGIRASSSISWLKVTE